jgi:cholesterol oxidase
MGDETARGTADQDRLVSITWPEFLQTGDAAEHAAPFDVVVVGSGYGGSMAVHTLSRAQPRDPQGHLPRVLLLERGRAFAPEDFPQRFAELPRELRVGQQTRGEVSNHEGLFDLRLGDDVAALVANGLGGGSLINAGVMLDPDPGDVKAPPLSAHLTGLLDDGCFKRARRMLGGEVWRNGTWVRNHVGRLETPLQKHEAYKRIAIRRNATAKPVDITVGLDNGPNFAGVHLNACVQCGDCMTGCRHGAKDSLDRNLLLAAQRAMGDRLVIVTGATVTSVVRPTWADREKELPPPHTGPCAWRLRVVHTDPRLQQREARSFRIKAQQVVLAAGTLGSPEILLRSRSDLLQFSATLGESFSGNGDDIAAVHRLSEEVHSSADEDIAPDQRRVGPTTTARVKLTQAHGRPFLLEEFSVPGPMRRLFEEVVTTGYTISRLPRGDCSQHEESDADPLAVDAAAMKKTLLVGVIGHDDAGGSLRLSKPYRPLGDVPPMGALRIHWPQARWGREFDATHESLRRFAEHPSATPEPENATLVANPMWRLLPQGLDDLVSQPRGPVLTVHPLGGCRMGGGSAEGVVDTWGRVFDAAPPADDAWFGSLVVLDGSIIGASLGVNPALTISALSLHAAEALCEDWGFALGPLEPDPAPDLPTHAAETHKARKLLADSPTPPPAPARTSLRVTERLWGPLDLNGQDCVAELTMAFVPTPVATLIGPARQPMDALPERSRLKLYDAAVWRREQLEGADDDARAPFVIYQCTLEGHLRFLHRARTTAVQRTLRGLWDWLVNRGTRDFWDRFLAPLLDPRLRAHRKALKAARPLPPGAPPKPSLFRRFVDGGMDFANLASHNGQVRLFDYRLQIGTVLSDPAGLGPWLKPGEAITGQKRLGYGRRSSPWTQLTEMQLTAMPGLRGTPGPLKLDGRFLARNGVPLIEVAHQRNHAEALAELLSFGLYMLRVLLDTHLWSFRKPDRVGSGLPGAGRRGEPERLPGNLPGIPAPEVTHLVVARWPKDSPLEGQPVTVRLTRYVQPADKPAGKPLVMIHGYSASGTTFAHSSLEPSAAQFFWQAGRDVWVLDLRTSCGLDSAAWPWSMEEVGAVDIPAALLHVRNCTGQRVDVLAHCIGGAMLGFALLTDENAVRSGEQQLGVDTFLTSEQFGVLGAFNGTAPAGGPHPTIDRIVLSQKGPLMRYTDENVLRAFILQYARRWLLPQGWSFRASANPGVAEELLDRLLSSLPYPRADFDVENPRRPCAKTTWTTTRHRLDALFGRTFTAANLRPQTLEAIDDFFGPINLDTVAQTIHFARFDAITNQRGRGEFVTRNRLAARWGGIRTLALHGRDNGLSSPYTLHLLAQSLADVGVPLTTQLLEDTGHQDTLIGRGARRVFRGIEAFLDAAPAPKPKRPDADPLLVALPWIGPRLAEPGTRRIAAMTPPNHGEATLWLVPVMQEAAPPVTGAARFSHTLLADAPAGWVKGDRGNSQQWLFALADPLAPAWPTGPAAGTPGWLALVVYETGETVAMARRNAVTGSPPAPAAGAAAAPDGPSPEGQAARRSLLPPSHSVGDSGFPLSGKAPLLSRLLPALQPAAAALGKMGVADKFKAAASLTAKDQAPDREVIDAIERWIRFDPQALLDLGFVALADVERCAALAEASTPLRFALGSCQYPHGLFDRDLADASLDRLALGEPAASNAAAPEPVGLALMVGDQIYADATAGLVDPTRRDEKYDLPHQRAFRLEGMRRVMRRMPVQMLLDDHEIFDNWEPLPTTLNPSVQRVEDEIERRKDARRDGVAAYQLYQRMLGRRLRGATGAGPQDFSFHAGGHAFYMLDTRSRRQRGSPSDGPAGGFIVQPTRRLALERWLIANPSRVKFIATPSILLPRRKELVGRDANTCRSDAWDGFPESMAWLLGFIADKAIRHVVFLSGDEHHSMHAEITLGSGTDAVRVLSVHSSGLYAPYPFANGRPQDLALTEGFPLGTLHVAVATTPAPAGDGFATLQVVDTGGVRSLHVEYWKPGGAPGTPYTLAL